MTKAKSQLHDNDGRCELCNEPATAQQTQTAYPVLLGAGLGWGTMWLCPACLAEKLKAKQKKA
jgi:hypothetical protein